MVRFSPATVTCVSWYRKLAADFYIAFVVCFLALLQLVANGSTLFEWVKWTVCMQMWSHSVYKNSPNSVSIAVSIACIISHLSGRCSRALHALGFDRRYVEWKGIMGYGITYDSKNLKLKNITQDWWAAHYLFKKWNKNPPVRFNWRSLCLRVSEMQHWIRWEGSRKMRANNWRNLCLFQNAAK